MRIDLPEMLLLMPSVWHGLFLGYRKNDFSITCERTKETSGVGAQGIFYMLQCTVTPFAVESH